MVWYCLTLTGRSHYLLLYLVHDHSEITYIVAGHVVILSSLDWTNAGILIQ